MTKDALEILYKTKNAVAVYKPAGMPSQSDLSGDIDALSAASELLLAENEPSKLWLVHRLDRVVGGVLIFARNSSAAAKISEALARDTSRKEYLAVAEGEVQGGAFEDFIYKDAKKSKAFKVDSERKGAKRAVAEYTALATAEKDGRIYTLVKVRLITGRYHQIRLQLSSRAHPIVGDGKYGSHDNRAKLPALFSHHIRCVFLEDTLDIKKLPSAEEYPWSLFKDVIKDD